MWIAAVYHFHQAAPNCGAVIFYNSYPPALGESDRSRREVGQEPDIEGSQTNIIEFIIRLFGDSAKRTSFVR